MLKLRDDHLLLWSIAVAVRRQKEGLGRELMAFCENHARKTGKLEIRLFTNIFMTENRAWYQRLGYVETGREQIGDKHVVHMAKHLA